MPVASDTKDLGPEPLSSSPRYTKDFVSSACAIQVA